jgi:hypothetical protein
MLFGWNKLYSGTSPAGTLYNDGKRFFSPTKGDHFIVRERR